MIQSKAANVVVRPNSTMPGAAIRSMASDFFGSPSLSCSTERRKK